MININKKSFGKKLLKVSQSNNDIVKTDGLIKYLQDDYDEMRRVKNPVRNDALYLKFERSVELIKQLLSLKTITGMAFVDNPDFPGSFHTINLFIDDGDLESLEDIKLFTEILECFDSLTMVGRDDFQVHFTLMIENIYTEK